MTFSSIARPKVILTAVIIVAIVFIATYFLANKGEKRYVYFVVEAKYKSRNKQSYTRRNYVSNVCEVDWSKISEENDKLRDKAMFQIRERVQALPDCEFIVRVMAPSYQETTYEAASEKMYASLRDNESYYAEFGEGMTETFNITKPEKEQ